MRIGIDVGGTFTDIVAIDQSGANWTVRKVPSTPDDPSRAVIQALDTILQTVDPAEIVFLGHGTTAGTNAFLTKRGATTALLTTIGFEDVLEFRRMDRGGILDPYDLQLKFPVPLVPGRRRFGVHERLGVGGEVITPLTEDEIDRVVELVRACGADAVAIATLWSFENPNHERMLRDAIEAALPRVFVTCSHEIDPSIMEYERTSTTVVNAYLGPLIAQYFGQVETNVKTRGLPDPKIMQSNGGLASIGQAGRRPVGLLESGPAAGVAACVSLAEVLTLPNLLAVDMGGTSFDVAMIVDGRPQQHAEVEVDGYVIRTPMLDIRSIGAGGGSIAWVDDGGSLRVGPQSAGSQPGPVCYGRGGTLPTVSDANAVLGYLHDLVGGDLQLDIDRARAALLQEIGQPLGLDALAAASGVRRLVNAHMADAMRVITGESAISPADLVLVAYGGAGPVHASALARELGIGRTIIPVHPGALSALGVAVGDLIHDFTDPILLPLDVVDPRELSLRFDAMTAKARTALADEGVDQSAMEFQPYMIARYIGQMHDLQVELPTDELHQLDPKTLAVYFHNSHKAAYGVAVDDEPVFVVDARVRAIGRVAKPDFRGAAGTEVPAPVRETEAWFEDVGLIATPVFHRNPWNPDTLLVGPAIIQEYDSTTVVLPGQVWHSDEVGSIVIEEN